MPSLQRGHRRHHRSSHAIRLSGLCCFRQEALDAPPGHEARTAPLRPEAPGGAAVCLDAGFRPWQKQSAERIRQVRACSSASRTEPTGGEDSCLRRQPPKDAAVLPFDEWQRSMKKGSGQPVSGAFLGFWVAASLREAASCRRCPDRKVCLCACRNRHGIGEGRGI